MGLSMIGWLAFFAASASIITLGLKTLPHYVNYQTILSVVDALPRDQVHEMTKSQIRDSIRKRLKINNVRDVEFRDIFVIDRRKVQTILELRYEHREHLLGNVDIVLSFKKSFEFS